MNKEQDSNPYEIVREEFEEKVTETETTKTCKGFDSKGRLVLIDSSITCIDGTKSHHRESVDSNGFWSGGMSIEHPDGSYISGQTAPRKFEE